MLVNQRDQIQAAIDQWHLNNNSKDNKHNNADFAAYKQHLVDIGYLQPQVGDFKVTTENVDADVTTIAGPSWLCRSIMPVMR